MRSMDQLEDLLNRMDRLHDGTAGPDDLARLEQLVHKNDALCWNYIRYSHLCACLAYRGEKMPPLKTGEVEAITSDCSR